MEDICNKIEVINTYLKDQDLDINNIELMQSKTMEEVQAIRKDINTIKTTVKSGTIISVVLLGLIFGMMLSERIKIRRNKK